jgi:hypothetical protein
MDKATQGEVDHFFGLRDHDRLAFEAPTSMLLPAMIPLDIRGEATDR